MNANPNAKWKPSLLDRLCDDEPGELREAPHKRSASVQELRESVVRDLGWLLNSVRLGATQDLAAYPYVARSVLNFGLPDLTGRTLSSIDLPELQAELRQAIVHFEPRLLPSSVAVRVENTAAESGHNSLQFTIEAQLLAHPLPLALWLRTEIDLESGEVSVAEWTKEPTPERS
jgi:type VI secretion system protein ImpF